jgi:hypothetical protein
MPKRKEKSETIIPQDQAKITPNNTNLLGETRTSITKILKGTITTKSKGGTTTTYRRTSLVPCVVSMVIILTIVPKLSASNG